jgi:hypothetical protein
MNPRRIFRIKAGAVLLVALSVIAGCGGTESSSKDPERVLDEPDGGDDSSDQDATDEETDNPEDTTTTSAPFASPADPREALGLYSFFNGGIPISEVSVSQCGQFAVAYDAITPRFLEFSSNQWVERSKLMPVLHNYAPDRVLSLDLNLDGALEFVFFFNSAERNEEKPFGSIFYQVDCEWKWGEIYQAMTGTSTRATNLDFDGSKNELFGYNVEDTAGYFVKHVLRYAPASRAFVYEPIVYDPPPVACVSAFASMYRSDNPDVIVSFYNNSVIRTLQNCREGDWIMEAKKRRSEYETFGDADYYEGNVILLQDENAKDIVETLCAYVNPSGYYIFRKISPVSIACED